MFLSLDFLYVPAPDIEESLKHYLAVPGAKLVWKIKDGGTTVAHVKISEEGPAFLLASHLAGEVPIFIYRVADFKKTLEDLRTRGWVPEGKPFEIPQGPCGTFRAPGGQRLAIYERVRPEAEASFQGRVDK